MNIVRRDTDYALRAMVNLAENYGDGASSTKNISIEENISYQLACKLMQKLHDCRLVKSHMGSKGGFRLSRDPSKISLLEVIKAIQGPIRLNRCLLGRNVCPQYKRCKVRLKLAELNRSISSYLNDVTLDELVRQRVTKRKGSTKNPNRTI